MEQTPDPKALAGDKTIEIARAHGVPVIVDAASQIYPLDLLGKYIRMGADYECVAAKYLGAPNSTGIAMGSAESIRKLSLHSFAAYEGRRIRGVGRPHKVDRQEMIGVVVALKRWVTMNHEDRLDNIEERCQSVLTKLKELLGVEATMIDNVIGHQPFGVAMKVDSAITGMTVEDIVDRLKVGDPSIWTRVRPDDTIIIHMFGLAEGEEQIVVEEIRKLLTP
jgi:L-seryl-tRNA(Ser) seleniumtransferase